MSNRKVPPVPLMSDEEFVAHARRVLGRAKPRAELEPAVPAFVAALLTTRNTPSAWRVLMKVVLALPTLKD